MTTYLNGQPFSNLPRQIINWSGIEQSPANEDPFGVSVATGANTTETTLGTYTIPANTFTEKGQGFILDCVIISAANANGKSTFFYFGDDFSINCSEVQNLNGKTAVFRFVVIRGAGETFFSMYVKFYDTGASGDSLDLLSTPIEVGWQGVMNGFPLGGGFIDWEVDNEIKVTGQNVVANAGDITRNSFILRPI